MFRSHLYAPGSNEKLLRRVFEAGADVVILDLEDAVPPPSKERARAMVAEALMERRAWVRINVPGGDVCDRDLEAVSGLAAGLRIPKVESPEQASWVAERAPGVPLVCLIESARGLAAAEEIAAAPQVQALALGAADLARDLGAHEEPMALLHARSRLVLASRLAGIGAPIDSVHRRLDDDEGLRAAAEHALQLGFFGKSAVHPRQVPIINQVFTPSAATVARAREVVEKFTAAGDRALRLADGEFVDLAVAERARQVLDLAERLQ